MREIVYLLAKPVWLVVKQRTRSWFEVDLKGNRSVLGDDVEKEGEECNKFFAKEEDEANSWSSYYFLSYSIYFSAAVSSV